MVTKKKAPRRRKAATKKAKGSGPATQLAPMIGDGLTIEKTSVVVDKERAQEGHKAGVLPPLEADVTGRRGHVVSTPYYNKKRRKTMVPMRLAHADGSPNPNGAIVSVPVDRLAPSAAAPRTGYSPEYAAGYEQAFRDAKAAQE